jgi:hypothetical protein
MTRFQFSLFDNCFLLRVGRLLWRENGPVICSEISHWLEARRTHNHILLSHERLSQGQTYNKLWCDISIISIKVGEIRKVKDLSAPLCIFLYSRIKFTLLNIRAFFCSSEWELSQHLEYNAAFLCDSLSSVVRSSHFGSEGPGFESSSLRTIISGTPHTSVSSNWPLHTLPSAYFPFFRPVSQARKSSEPITVGAIPFFLSSKPYITDIAVGWCIA